MNKFYFLRPYRLFIFLAIIAVPLRSAGQCSAWSATATLTASASCAANGSFTVSLLGPDAANLTNIRYGIPISPNGFSVPLNSSPSFTGIPGGVYQVSVVADCGGTIVGRNTTITVPGAYAPPTLTAAEGRPSFNCAPTGILKAMVQKGAGPYTYTLTAFPPAYTGPTTATSPNATYSFQNLPPGSYTVQAVDACLSGTIPASATITSLVPANAPYTHSSIRAAGCDSVMIPAPAVQQTGGWAEYRDDTTFKVAVQISGGILAQTAFIRMHNNWFDIPLPAGKTIKDLYGKTVTYTIQPPCGPSVTRSYTISAPVASISTGSNCNDFFAYVTLSGLYCLPISVTLRNSVTGTVYGPFVSTNGGIQTPNLPYGTYTSSLTTGDGYSAASGSITVNPVNGNPYSVKILNGAYGLHNFIEGFEFSIPGFSNAIGARSIELFSGPVGYSGFQSWSGSFPAIATLNGSRTPTTLRFPAGQYVWKITDNCGVYYLPITVGPEHLYQFSVSAPAQMQSCQGLWITPAGTADSAGNPKPVGFSLLLDGMPLMIRLPNGSNSWPVYPAGTPILLTLPGVYTIVPTAHPTRTVFVGYYSPPGGFIVTYPNIYTASYTFTYNPLPVSVDMNQTQGFVCKGAGTGQAKIFARGKDGMAFRSAPNPHYTYHLAAQGAGLSGPYLATNNTGVFSGFGGNALATFDLKVTDSCGGFAIQPIKILDLGSSPLISSSTYVGCAFGDVRLSAAYLPGATYAWTGPNGFSSTQRAPLLTNISALHTGVYRVSITTSECPGTFTDSTVLTLNAPPPKPQVVMHCQPKPIMLEISNPGTGLVYQWDIGYLTGLNSLYTYKYGGPEPSDTLFMKEVDRNGKYTAVATDTITGCQSYSDTLTFNSYATSQVFARIYSPHLQVCAGDTTILVAQGQGGAPTPTFQWFMNGSPIPGATSESYVTSIAGSYSVSVRINDCDADTSPPVTVSIVPVPTASLTASRLSICSGDTALLQANTGTGYSYSWNLNGATIPKEFSSSLKATQAGSYFVIVSNGGCIAQSPAIAITVNPSPVIPITPNLPQEICAGDSVVFVTNADPGYAYTWQRDGVNIPGGTANTYTARVSGAYRVVVATSQCPNLPSITVPLQVLPAQVGLRADTTICDSEPFAIPLSVAPGFTQVSWSTGDTGQFITATAPGLYIATAVNRCGTFRDTFRIYTPADHAPALPDDTLICNSTGILRLTVPAGLSGVSWSTGATGHLLEISAPGTYWMAAQSPCGAVYDTVQVRFCAPLIRGLSLSQDSICEGNCLTFAARADQYPDDYRWDFPGGSPGQATGIDPGSVCYGLPGVYPVRLIVQNKGGADTITQQVVVLARPVSPFTDTLLTVRYKSIINIPACTGAQRADWYIGDSLICAGCPELKVDGRYYLTEFRCVVSNGDCRDSCNYTLRVIDIPHDVWLPDAFTPNKDGRNDGFRVITDNPNVQVVNLDVFNRWGQRVFASNLNNGGWDGTHNGSLAAPGVYFWQLRYRISGSPEQVYQQKGDVLLIR